MSNKRIEKKTSRTAEWTCVSRAASALEADGPYRGDDNLALRLIPGFLKTGAGFDTRALRFGPEAARTMIFEMDAAVTQAAKIGRYKEKGIDIPAHLCFIAMDFDRDSLVEKLEASGFQKDRKTLFMMEGLLMYLDPESVEKTFGMIHDFAGKGSEVAFDYVRAEVFRNPKGIYGGTEILQSTAKAGEKWRFGMDEDQIDLFLEPYGLKLMDHKNAEDLEKQYFTERPGKLPGRINATHGLVRARKNIGNP